jgi:hypothetical protein
VYSHSFVACPARETHINTHSESTTSVHGLNTLLRPRIVAPAAHSNSYTSAMFRHVWINTREPLSGSNYSRCNDGSRRNAAALMRRHRRAGTVLPLQGTGAGRSRWFVYGKGSFIANNFGAERFYCDDPVRCPPSNNPPAITKTNTHKKPTHTIEYRYHIQPRLFLARTRTRTHHT